MRKTTQQKVLLHSQISHCQAKSDFLGDIHAGDRLNHAMEVCREIEEKEYNRDLKLRLKNGQVGSGMKFRG